MKEEVIVTIKQLADIIGYSYDTVIEWPKTRNMPIHRIPPRGRIEVYMSEFEPWWKNLRNDS